MTTANAKKEGKMLLVESKKVRVEDRRYEVVRLMLQQDKIERFVDIFQYIPRTTVFHEFNMSYYRFCRLFINCGLLRINEIERFAGLFGVDEMLLIKLVLKSRDLQRQEWKSFNKSKRKIIF